MGYRTSRRARFEVPPVSSKTVHGYLRDAVDTRNTNHMAIEGTPNEDEDFIYDQIGNWKSYRKDLGGVPAIEQDRVSNLNNQITQIYPNDPTPQYPGYDANGNTTEVPTGEALDGPENQLVWDAWNRLRKVLDEEDDPIVEYQYDGQFRRTVSQAGGVTRHFYYNDAWRSVEERLDSSSDPVAQYVWQPGKRWELILWDRDTTGDGTLDERRYCLKDDVDVVALCDETGTVTERFAYSAFGRVTFMDAAFAAQPSSASGWNLLFHAEFVDAETGWTNYGFRSYSTELGRWPSRDPISENGGINLYAYVANGPMNGWDPHGAMPLWLADLIVDSEGWTRPLVEGFSGFGDSFTLGLSELGRKGLEKAGLYEGDGDMKSSKAYKGGGIGRNCCKPSRWRRRNHQGAGGIKNVPLYELGQKWLPSLARDGGHRIAQWNRHSSMEKGARILKAAKGNWAKAVAPKLGDILKPFGPKALKTGLTPLALGVVHAGVQGAKKGFFGSDCP